MRLTVLLLVIVLSTTICVRAFAQIKQSQLGRGDEWLSWHPEQRIGYVYGYIDGYLGGTLRSCDLADELFEKGKSHTLGDGHKASDMPSSRCLAQRGEFSKILSDRKFDKDNHLDVSVYTDVITAFYEKHSNCRDHPFAFLLEALSSNYLTADQLYESISRGELKSRSRVWCGLDTTPK